MYLCLKKYKLGIFCVNFCDQILNILIFLKGGQLLHRIKK